MSTRHCSHKFNIISTVLVTVVAIALTGCGGGDSSNGKLSSAVKEAVISAAGSADSPMSVSDKEGQCIADEVLKDADAATALKDADAAGKTGQDLLDAIDSTDPKFGKAVFLCLDVEKIVEAFSSSLTADGTLTTDETKCLVGAFKKVDKNDLADALASSGSQTTDSTNAASQEIITQLTNDIAVCTGTSVGS